MTIYHQMGHGSRPLLESEGLERFCGAILSPVNEDPAAMAKTVRIALAAGLELIFDPQLYAPRTSRGKLPLWQYYPADAETASLANIGWWKEVCEKVESTIEGLGVNAVASPCEMPSSFSQDYFSLCVEVGNMLHRSCGERVRVLQTVIVDSRDLTSLDRVQDIADIVTRFEGSEVYLILKQVQASRTQSLEAKPLFLFSTLIRKLSEADLRVTVGYCDVELVLWRFAGAEAVASGKYWNVRKFDGKRFGDEESTGGKPVGYWFEPSLLAYISESDVLRLEAEGKLPAPSLSLSKSLELLNFLKDPSRGKTAWVRRGMDQQLQWLSELEQSPMVSSHQLLEDFLAEVVNRWLWLQDEDFLFDNASLSASHVQALRIALGDLRRLSR